MGETSLCRCDEGFKLFWIIWVGPKCNHKRPYKETAEGHHTHTHSVKTEAETAAM